MNPEGYPTEIINNPEIAKEESLREEVKGSMRNDGDLRNTVSVLVNAGLDALKGIFRK